MNKIIVASNNKGKIKEFNQILNSRFDLISMSELNIQELPETGLTFVENAIIKARNASKLSSSLLGLFIINLKCFSFPRTIVNNNSKVFIYC